MSTLRVNTITDEAGTGGPEFSKGVTFPASQTFGTELKINTTGIGTFATLKADNVNIAGVLTATSFVGRGHGLTGIPGETTGKIIGLHLIT